MLNVRELYEDFEEGQWDDYYPITDSIGKILVEEEDTEYGNHLVLYKSTKGKPRLGVLVLDKGTSLSDDPIRQCKTWKELQSLADEIVKSVFWTDDINECVNYIVFEIYPEDSWRIDKDKMISFIKRCCYVLCDKNNIASVLSECFWKSCDEVPPPKDEYVYAVGRRGGVAICKFFDTVEENGKTFYRFWSGNLSVPRIMGWWMEVPKLPNRNEVKNATNL